MTTHDKNQTPKHGPDSGPGETRPDGDGPNPTRPSHTGSGETVARPSLTRDNISLVCCNLTPSLHQQARLMAAMDRTNVAAMMLAALNDSLEDILANPNTLWERRKPSKYSSQEKEHPKNIQINTRVPTNLHERLKIAAVTNRTTINAIMIAVLEETLRRRGTPFPREESPDDQFPIQNHGDQNNVGQTHMDQTHLGNNHQDQHHDQDKSPWIHPTQDDTTQDPPPPDETGNQKDDEAELHPTPQDHLALDQADYNVPQDNPGELNWAQNLRESWYVNRTEHPNPNVPEDEFIRIHRLLKGLEKDGKLLKPLCWPTFTCRACQASANTWEELRSATSQSAICAACFDLGKRLTTTSENTAYPRTILLDMHDENAKQHLPNPDQPTGAWIVDMKAGVRTWPPDSKTAELQQEMPFRAASPSQPDEPQPDEPQPDEPQPDEPQPDEPQPDEPQPDEPQPDEPQPDEPQPDEPQPDEPNPNRTNPNRTNPNPRTNPNRTNPNRNPNRTPTGRTPTGRTPTGRTPTGRTPTGRTPTGRTPTGRTPTGRTPTGRTPTGRTPTG